MSLVDCISPASEVRTHLPYNNLTASPNFLPHCATFTRSLTFPKTKASLAQDPVRQVSRHLSRSNTGASRGCDKQETANNIAPLAAETEKSCKTMTDNESHRICGFCKNYTIPMPRGPDGQPLEDKSNQLVPAPSEKKARHKEFAVCLPPGKPSYGKITLFTAGSIEMGAAVKWQDRLVDHLQHLPITICNPRRGYWDPEVDVKSKDLEFRIQVEWEMNALTEATIICFFFDTDTISPITLMELGLWASSGKALVCCGGNYWRSGNVDIVCDRYNIPRVDSFEMLIPAVKELLERKGMALDSAGNLKDGPVRPVESDESEKQWWLRYRDPAKVKAELEAKNAYAEYKAADEKAAN